MGGPLPAIEQVQGGEKKNLRPGASGSHVSFFLAWQDTKRLQVCSQELEQRLFSKEQELEQLIQKQRRVCSCPCPRSTCFSLHPLLWHLPTSPAIHLRTLFS